MNMVTGCEKEVTFGELSPLIQKKLREYQQRTLEPNWTFEEFLEDYTFRIAKIQSVNDCISLPFAYFDMRGDGDTFLLKEELVNIEILAEQVIYAVGTVLCKKTKKEAYAFYLIDDSNIVIIEIE